MFRMLILLPILLLGTINFTIFSAYAEQQNVFNPDIGVVGALNIQKNDSNAYVPAIGEIELNISAPVDPLGRAVFTLAAAPNAIEIEEAYLKLTNLPFELIGRLGRVKVDFNRLNTLHPHEFPFIGQVKYLQDFFGEGGLIEDGFELSAILPTFFSYSDLTVGFLGNNTNNSFTGNKPIICAKWNNFLETGDNSGIELGFSFLTGTDKAQITNTIMEGVSFRVKQQIDFTNYIIWDNELLVNNANINSATKIGGFNYLGYNFNKQYQLGAGVNYTVKPDGSKYNDIFIAAQYKVTEFQIYKLQLARDGQNNYSVGFNLTYFIGPHPVHEF